MRSGSPTRASGAESSVTSDFLARFSGGAALVCCRGGDTNDCAVDAALEVEPLLCRFWADRWRTSCSLGELWRKRGKERKKSDDKEEGYSVLAMVNTVFKRAE